MPAWEWAAWVAVVTVAVYLAFLGALLLSGRRSGARALAGFIPDCIVLFRRLVGDSRVPRSRKIMLVALLVYLAMPFDLVPDFLPVVGQLDDAIIVALVLRSVRRASGPTLVEEHWPGPTTSREVVLRLAYPRGR